MANELSRLALTLAKKFDTSSKELSSNDAMIAESALVVEKIPTPKVVFQGLAKAYMDFINKSKGLTTARPATIKAVQAAEKAPSEASLKLAIAEMTKHIAELEKTKKGDKAFVKFQAEIEGLIMKVQKLI
jgi:hypothetical protein